MQITIYKLLEHNDGVLLSKLNTSENKSLIFWAFGASSDAKNMYLASSDEVNALFSLCDDILASELEEVLVKWHGKTRFDTMHFQLLKRDAGEILELKQSILGANNEANFAFKLSA